MRPKGIEAWQVALVAVAHALDIDCEADHPGKRAWKPLWPRFSEYLEGSNRSKANCDFVDAEQIYLQVFVFEQALGKVQTVNVQLAEKVMDAWYYYIRTLPQEHGIVFDYQIWSQRRATYAKEWDEALERIRKNPGAFKNPFYHLACCFIEDVCHINADIKVLVSICLSITARIKGFTGAMSKWIVDRE
jgi:hypothetical protein